MLLFLLGLFEPAANKPTADVFTIDVSDGGKVRYTGIDTRFRIAAVFKADGRANKELTVLLFSDEHTAIAVLNGPAFIYFPVGPGKPLWCAFLKHRVDGRYEPASGQEDADESFFKVHKPARGSPR